MKVKLPVAANAIGTHTESVRIKSSLSRRPAVPAENHETTGRDDWIRTSDPHTPSMVRYQTALRPEASGGGAIGPANEHGKYGLAVFVALPRHCC